MVELNHRQRTVRVNPPQDASGVLRPAPRADRRCVPRARRAGYSPGHARSETAGRHHGGTPPGLPDDQRGPAPAQRAEDRRGGPRDVSRDALARNVPAHGRREIRGDLRRPSHERGRRPRIDQQVHLGADLASVRGATIRRPMPVMSCSPPSWASTATASSWITGWGVESLYAHLSSIDVDPATASTAARPSGAAG